MNIYKISSTRTGWDTYSDAIVVAESSAEAKTIHPDGEHVWRDGQWISRTGNDSYCEAGEWDVPETIAVELVGTAHKRLAATTVLCASYHAG